MPVTGSFMPPYRDDERSETDRHTTYSGRASELAVRSFLAAHARAAGPIDADVEAVDLIVDHSRRTQVKKAVRTPAGGFVFPFQNVTGRRQYGPETVDLFFHVIITRYRQLIFETPAADVPLRPDGTFTPSIEAQLETDYHVRKRPLIEMRQRCVQQLLDPALFSSVQLTFM